MLLRFLYTGDFKVLYVLANIPKSNMNTQTVALASQSEGIPTTLPSQPNTKDISGGYLLQLTKLYIVADRLAIEPLKRISVEKYTKQLPSGFESAGFSTSLKLMFEATLEEDRALKDIAIAYAGTKAKQLLGREDFVTMFKESVDIGFEIFQASVNGGVVKTSDSTTGVSAADKAKGCPWSGSSHASFIETGRVKAYFCTSCKKQFDQDDFRPTVTSFGTTLNTSTGGPFGRRNY